MRKNKLFLLGIFTVMVALVSLTLVSNTWAKYTSSVSGEASARVAKWGWDYGTVPMNLSADTIEIEFNLLETRTEYDSSDAEEDVAANLLAPGTQGQFELDFKNTSEVNAEYTVNFTVTNDSEVPLEYKVNDGEWQSTLNNISEPIEVAMNTTSTVTVQWRWAFVGNDAVDTNLGITTPTVTVEADITFTQVD